MSGFALNLSGVERLEKRLKDLSTGIGKDIVDELSASTMNIEKKAKRNAPVNLGTLRQSIHAVSDSALTHKVIVDVSYGAYVEFGTGGEVSIPSGYEQYAAQFMGKTGGKFIDLINALAEWVKRKGISGTYSVKTQRRTGSKSVRNSEDRAVAYAIAIKILRNGLKAQPYLIPAYEEEKPKLIKRLKDILNAKS